MTDGPKQAPRGKRGLVLGATGIAVVVGGYLGAAAIAARQAPEHVNVVGVRLSDDAKTSQQALADGLTARAAAPVSVSVAAKTAKLDPRAAGLSVDVPATVQEATGFSVNPSTIWKRLRGEHSVRPVLTIDQSKLSTELARVASATKVKEASGKISLAGGRIKRTEAIIGVDLDTDQAGNH